jgi:Rrf2 family transcriptional regulator, iron-sulfur cluster assembly transcription factor
MLCLARHPAGTRLAVQQIQETMLIPRSFLNRIVADLSRVKLIATFPGPSGGLELAQPAGETNLRQIWEAVEGPLLISDCLKAPGECPLDQGCPVRQRWARLQGLIIRELESTTLRQLADEAERLTGVIPLPQVVSTMLMVG